MPIIADTETGKRVLTTDKYIEREKVLAKAAHVEGYFSDMISAYDVAMIPAADVVEVVRCRDCLYMEKVYDGLYCSIWKAYSRKDGFCHHGNRKENADNEND